jgi:hypothetical protein
MEEGALTPVVGAELPYADAATAHAQVTEPPAGGKAGNLVLLVEHEPE